jgi:hypothetical protein
VPVRAKAILGFFLHVPAERFKAGLEDHVSVDIPPQRKKALTTNESMLTARDNQVPLWVSHVTGLCIGVTLRNGRGFGRRSCRAKANDDDGTAAERPHPYI